MFLISDFLIKIKNSHTLLIFFSFFCVFRREAFSKRFHYKSGSSCVSQSTTGQLLLARLVHSTVSFAGLCPARCNGFIAIKFMIFIQVPHCRHEHCSEHRQRLDHSYCIRRTFKRSCGHIKRRYLFSRQSERRKIAAPRISGQKILNCLCFVQYVFFNRY